MRRHLPRLLVILLTIVMLATGRLAAAAQAEPGRVPLARALSALARETGAELLFDENLVRGLTARPIGRQVSVETGLAILLEGTGLGYRRTSDGAYVLDRPGRPPEPAPVEEAIAEILVTTRRTQNADIRRTENDIQPYRVTTARQLQDSHRDDLDQFFHARLTANTDVLAPSQTSGQAPGSNQSRVDLRGLGSQRTLVLIDGRRIPGFPSRLTDFDQADVNGVPINAIERIETLTGTAGGIYGAGAIGGVVNVILKRDYRGADLFVTSGLTDRGDAGRIRIEGRIGFTPDGGTTDVMVYGALSFSQRLRYEQRDYEIRARRLAFANDPEGYLAPGGYRNSVLPGNAVLVTSVDGRPLSLDPEFGGTHLGASFTYLPLDFQGTDADRRAALVANAGKIDLGPPPDFSGRRRSLVNAPDVVTGLFNIRRRFGDDVEAFFDGIYFRNRGRIRYGATALNANTLADAPNNPFAQRVYFRYPSGFDSRIISDSYLLRLVGGLIVDLPGAWRGSAEFAYGSARYDAREFSSSANNSAYLTAMGTGLPGGDGRPALFPLGDWASFRAAQAAYFLSLENRFIFPNRFVNASVRLGGPVIALPGGDLAMNLLGEVRRERIPDVALDVATADSGPLTLYIQQRTQKIGSAYAEVRAPLVARDSGLRPLRGLELQFAARFDGLRARIPQGSNIISFEPTLTPLVSIQRNALVFTAGARMFPLPWLMLRGSYATGRLPPTLAQLQQFRSPVLFAARPLDPRRPGRRVGTEGPLEQLVGGSNDIAQEAGRTFSIGAVLNPDGGDAPRLSVDYSRIATRGEPLLFPLSPAALVGQEPQYPDRVVRAPLTDADRALGFTGGPIILLDLRSGNFGRRIVETVDFQFDWRFRDILGGELAPYAQATWLPSLRTRSAPGQPWIERSGYLDGPVRWRANGGVTWSRGASSIDLNLQYYHGYRVIMANPTLPTTNAELLRFQGRARIPAQAYVDLAGRHRFDLARGPMRSIEVRLGILNLFDHSPPILADPGNIGYSAYGDPRRRRFELVVASEF